MYEDLIKRLRDDEAWKNCDFDFIYGWMHEAADAIEELSKPRWIPVTEQKPKTDDIVIVAIHDDSGDTPYDVTNVGFYLDVFPLGIWVVENERCNYVTHWMRLPEPPEELTGTDMRGGIRRDDVGNVIDWGITGPPGEAGKTEEGE
jgi:hypothetical protein